MIDQIRSDIQQRLNQLLAEADKLRRALAALGGGGGSSDGDGAAAAPSAPASTPAPRARRASRRTRSSSTATRTRSTASTASTGSRGRAASGATRSAVLEALSGGKAMTAGEVAAATGLGRASVSTTLSKLAKSGEVNKADRGYQLKSGS
jgi:DNA-binding transcriptional ArsR family regulator